MDLLRAPVWLVLFLVCGGVHEFAHAWTAWKLGDDTAARQGRLTLNPIPHIDPMGLLMLVISSAIGFGIGWMKPVPVSVYNLGNPKRDYMLVSAAGPTSNIIMAFIFIMIAQVAGIQPNYMATGVPFFLFVGIMLNLILAAFNLLPVPPLDGFAVLTGLLPTDASISYERFMGQFGPLVFLAILFFPGYFLFPVMKLLSTILYTIAGFGSGSIQGF